MTNLTHGFLQIREQVAYPAKQLDPCDVFLFCQSSEERGSFALQRLKMGPLKSVLRVKFAPALAKPEVPQAAKAMLAALKKKNLLRDIQCKESTNIAFSGKAILEALETLVSTKKDIRICVDITTMPKAYILTILAWAFKSIRLPSIRFVYSPGDFLHLKESNSHFPGTFTDGPWEVRFVPYLEPPATTDDDRRVIAFVGADLDRVEQVLRRYEPLKKTLIYPLTKIRADKESEVQGVKKDLSLLFGLDDIQVCERSSVIEPLLELRKLLGYSEGKGILFPFATKLTALSCGIYAMFDATTSLYVRVPTKYVAMNVAPQGALITIDLTDITHRDAFNYL